MEDETFTYEYAARALTALRDALSPRLGASSEAESIRDALSTVQRLLSGLENLKVSPADSLIRSKVRLSPTDAEYMRSQLADSMQRSESCDIQALHDSIDKDLSQALRVLLSHDQDQAYDLIARLQNYIWHNVVPFAWQLDCQADRQSDPEQPNLIRLTAQHLSTEFLRCVTDSLHPQHGGGDGTQGHSERSE